MSPPVSWPPPDIPPSRPTRGRAAIYTTLLVGAFLLGCIQLISPPFAIALLCFAALLLVQYLLWGWWLSALLPRESSRLEEAETNKPA